MQENIVTSNCARSLQKLASASADGRFVTRTKRRFKKALLLGNLFAMTVGCQTSQLAENYQDRIDHIADKNCSLDNLYRPGLDLNRMGYPDWYQYSINDHLYPYELSRGRRPLPSYTPNPIYRQSQERPQLYPLPVSTASLDDPSVMEFTPSPIPDSPLIQPIEPKPAMKLPTPNLNAIPAAPPPSSLDSIPLPPAGKTELP